MPKVGVKFGIERSNAAIYGRSGMALFVLRTKRDSTRSSATLLCYELTRLHASVSIVFKSGQFSVPANDTRFWQLYRARSHTFHKV